MREKTISDFKELCLKYTAFRMAEGGEVTSESVCEVLKHLDVGGYILNEVISKHVPEDKLQEYMDVRVDELRISIQHMEDVKTIITRYNNILSAEAQENLSVDGGAKLLSWFDDNGIDEILTHLIKENSTIEA